MLPLKRDLIDEHDRVKLIVELAYQGHDWSALIKLHFKHEAIGCHYSSVHCETFYIDLETLECLFHLDCSLMLSS